MAAEDDALAQAVREAFPGADGGAILARLASYGAAPHEREPARVRRAIVALAQGDAARLEYLIGVAKQDYRDVLAWASGPPPSPQEGERAAAAAKALIEKWGRK